MSAAFACSMLVHILALHSQSGFKTETPGLGLVCERGDAVAAAGVFSNSIGRESRYLAAGWQPLTVGPARVGFLAGAMDGYAYRNGRAFPFAALTVSVPAGPVTARFMVIPKSRISPTTVALAFSF